MRYEFKAINKIEYADFLRNCNARYFYSQSAEYTKVCESMGRAYEILALFAEEEVVAAAIVFKFRHHKIFQKAELIYGPIVKDENVEYFNEYIRALKEHFKKELRVVSLQISPLIQDKYFDDIEVIGVNPNAIIAQKALKDSGYKLIDKDFIDDRSIQIQHVYVKDIEKQKFEELQKSFTYNLRNEFKKARELGIQVRFLRADEMHIFDDIIADTSKRLEHDISLVNTNYIAENYSEAYYPVSYIDVNYSLKVLNENLESAQEQVQKLEDDIEKFGESKKRLNKLKDANIILEKAKEKLETISILAEKYGDVIYMSTGSFYYSPSDMVYLQGGMKREFEAFYPNHALLEKMIKLAIEKGCKYFNFFGVSAASLVDENAADYGVLQFKRNFTGEVQEFLGTFKYTYIPFI